MMALDDLLQIKRESIKEDIQKQEAEQKLEFAGKLIKQGIFSFLNEFYLSLDKTNFERNVIRTKMLTLIHKVLIQLTNPKIIHLFKEQVSSDMVGKLVCEILITINSFAKSLWDQKLHGLPQGDNEVRHLKESPLIVLRAFDLLNILLVNYPLCLNAVYEFPASIDLFRMLLIDINQIEIQS